MLLLLAVGAAAEDLHIQPLLMHGDGLHGPSLAKARLSSMPNVMISNGRLEEVDVPSHARHSRSVQHKLG
jgi:hypothetical protein